MPVTRDCIRFASSSLSFQHSRVTSSCAQHRSRLLLAPAVAANGCWMQQPCNTIKSIAWREEGWTRPKPFPYLKRKMNLWDVATDNLFKRFDENTKIIVVDGPTAAGKTDLAKALAESFDMLYMPEANMDLIYVNAYGIDCRYLDAEMPERCKSYDVTNFHQNPRHDNAHRFQMLMYLLRYGQYVDALQHVLNTGQGVVMDRSVFSDFIFLEAMVKYGFLNPNMPSFYYESQDSNLHILMKPHLVIYLDVPVPVIIERIKKRNRPHEVDSEASSPRYLQLMEEAYKEKFLPDISAYSEVLAYDWSEYGDPDIVIEDIEKIDFDRFTLYDKKLRQWRITNHFDFNDRRAEYTNERHHLLDYGVNPRLTIPEMVMEAEDVADWERLWKRVPGNKYKFGYNAEAGDKNVLWKFKDPHHRPPLFW